MPTISPTTGSIFWIPQLYLNYKIGSHKDFVSHAIYYKAFRVPGHIACISYLLYTGHFWPLLRNHPFALVGILLDDLVILILVNQYKKCDDSKGPPARVPQNIHRNVNNHSRKITLSELAEIIHEKWLPDVVPRKQISAHNYDCNGYNVRLNF